MRQPGSTDLWDIIYLLREHAGRILLCVLLAVVLAVAYLRGTRPLYASTALLEVAPDAATNADGTTNGANADEDDASDVLKTIELKIAGDGVALAAIRDCGLAADPDFAPPRPEGAYSKAELDEKLGPVLGSLLRAAGGDRLILGLGIRPPAPRGPYSDSELIQRFARKVQVGLVRGSRAISVTAEDHDPERAQRIVRSVIDEFYRQSLDRRQRDADSFRDLLVGEARRIGDDFRTSQERLEAYRDKHNSVSLEERQDIVVERLRDLNRQVAEAKNVRISFEAEQASVRRMGEGDPERLLSLAAIADLPEIIELRKQIDLQEASVATLARRYGPLHPTMIAANGQLEEFHTSLRTAIRKAADRIVRSYEAALDKEKALQAALDDQSRSALELARVAIPYRALEHQVQADAETYQKVLDDLRQADVTRSLMTAETVDGAEIRVIERPMAPALPRSPRPSLLFALSVVSGLFVGCGSALASRALETAISSVDEAESSLGLPVLAAVTQSRHRRLKARPLVISHPDSASAEAFRSLRTSLALLGEEDSRRCVLFTSAVPGEGKSFCCLNLGAAFAQQGLRTLIVDADLRRPTLQWLPTGPAGRPPLSDCLRDPANFEAAVQATAVDNLFWIGDRVGSNQAFEYLDRERFAELIRRSLAEFDRVVIDTAPILAVSDSLTMAQAAPTIWLVVHAGRTPKRLVRRALKVLAETARRPASGVLLNQISPKRSAVNYYHYYGTEVRA